ncbi:hypothetical protein [Hymenobacter agri]
MILLRLRFYTLMGGTAEPERFVVRRYADSTVVRVYASAKPQPAGADSLHFKRTYFRRETTCLSLDGLGGDDVFEITTAPDIRPMRVELYGGEGHDQLRLQGSAARLKSYDSASDMTAAGAHRPSLPRKKRRAYNRLNDD